MRKKQDRKKRLPFGVPRLHLSLDDETVAKLKSEKKEARWFKDDGQRIQRALDGGWDFVTTNVKVGDEEEEQSGRIKHTGKGGTVMYLMAIPKDWYDEDQAAKEESNKKVDDAIRGGQPGGLKHHGVEPGKGGSYVKGVDYAP